MCNASKFIHSLCHLLDDEGIDLWGTAESWNTEASNCTVCDPDLCPCQKKPRVGWEWRCRFLIPELRRQRQVDVYEFKANLDYIVSKTLSEREKGVGVE